MPNIIKATYHGLHGLLVLLIVALVAGCAPSHPSGVLSHSEMADVLYDMHLAQSLYDEPDIRQSDADIIMLRNEVLKKHDITQQEWDSSFNYYCRNTYELHSIYKDVTERIERNVIVLGGKVEGVQGDDADTCNVWNLEPAFVLMKQPPFNQMSFSIEPDSTFVDGDRITLQFDAQMLFQDGYRDLTAYLAVYYDNDSIAIGVRHVNGDQHCVLTINNDVDRLHVKAIKGYLYLIQNLAQEETSSQASTLRFAAISSVKLLHQHTDAPAGSSSSAVTVAPQMEDAKKDSLRRDSMKLDSMKIKTKPLSVPKANIDMKM